ncbi:MAG: hypothetical protein Kow00117_15270 [Phototrophicales bacterium]
MIELLAFIALLVVGWVVLTSLVSFAVTLGAFIFMVLVWIFIGWLAGQLIRGKGYGPIKDGLLGLLGGVIGSIVLGIFGLDIGGVFGAIVTGVFGALILVYGVRALSDNKDFAA